MNFLFFFSKTESFGKMLYKPLVSSAVVDLKIKKKLHEVFGVIIIKLR